MKKIHKTTFLTPLFKCLSNTRYKFLNAIFVLSTAKIKNKIINKYVYIYEFF